MTEYGKSGWSCMESILVNTIIIAVLCIIFSFPSHVTARSFNNGRHPSTEKVLVVTTLAPDVMSTLRLEHVGEILPEIYSFRVQSDIKHRYSRTLITSRVVNRDKMRAHPVTLRVVVLPETAFISKFVMVIDGSAYEAYVKEKEQARKDYAHAQRQGQSAGLVEKSTRNTNAFNVNINVKPQSKVTFNLTYEELLKRKLGRYEQSININPDQVSSVKDYNIVVNIEESRSLAFVRVPNLSSNHIETSGVSGVVIERPTPNEAKILWSPTIANQSNLDKESIFGRFVVHYDVDRKADAGQVLLMQGHFVHFFSADNLAPMRKHVVFVLDTSGSMTGRKIEQLKESQKKILDDLSADDYFNIITFSSDVNLWSVGDEDREPLPATRSNIDKAKLFIDSLEADGGTNINGAIIDALSLISRIRNYKEMKNAFVFSSQVMALPRDVQSLVVFLTDGQPTVGITQPPTIQNRIEHKNRNLAVPIFSLGFGTAVDFSFLKTLSLQNNGFARKIYEASDAALQLQGFYSEISSPLLSNVTFNYISDEYSVTDVTVARFPTMFDGAEIVVAGKFVGLTNSRPFGGRNGAVVVQAAGQQNKPYRKRIMSVFHENPYSNEDIPQVNPCDFEKKEKYYFNVNVRGSGREGEVILNHVYEQPSSLCGGDAHFPPRIDLQILTNPPPSRSTPEDKFLERLWAYLTISQLIENESGDSNELREQKKRALELALKYGFVTSLTSLVVVKPNISEVTDTVAVDHRSRAIEHRSSAVDDLSSATDDRSGATDDSSSYKLYDDYESEGDPYGHERNPHVYDDGFFGSRHDYDDDEDSPPQSPPQTTTTTTTSAPRLTLSDITWLSPNNSTISVMATEYLIAKGPVTGDNEDYVCNDQRSGETGRCRHLQKCVMHAILREPSVYRLMYFCKIKVTHWWYSDKMYAGICCPSSYL